MTSSLFPLFLSFFSSSTFLHTSVHDQISSLFAFSKRRRWEGFLAIPVKSLVFDAFYAKYPYHGVLLAFCFAHLMGFIKHKSPFHSNIG